MTLPSGDVVKFIDNTSGYTKNTGTITGVTAGTGLSGGGTSGSVTLNHSNSVTAQTTQAVYPIKIDAQGHISAYGSAVTIPSAVTESTVSGWGFTKNAGTVTSVRVQATSPVSSSVSTAQSGSLNTTISLSDGYGDTKNPYGVKDAHVVLAGPSTGADAAPTFRALVADDIPSITKSKISDFPTSMTPTSHAHGNITNAGDITTTSTIANGDRLVINDESASKVTNSSITFGTSTSTYLRNDGTWGTPSGTATGTITGVTAGAGLSGGGTSGAVTLKHSNSVTAQTTQAVYPIKIDAQGHISAYGSAVTIPAAVAVKGDAETSYRKGNVNLTPANLGAMPNVTYGNPVVVVNTTTLNFSKDGDNSWYITAENPMSGFTNASFLSNNLYKIEWDGVEYESYYREAEKLKSAGGYYGWGYIGNVSPLGWAVTSLADKELPFCIEYDFYRNAGEVQVISYDTASTHTIKITRIPYTKVVVDKFLYEDITSNMSNIRWGSGNYGVVVGSATDASGQDSFAVGSAALASASNSMALGWGVKASQVGSFAEGVLCIASGSASHSEGAYNEATAQASHAEGQKTIASGRASHAEGYYTIANHQSQHTFGEYNIADTSTAGEMARGNYIEIVGNGTSDSARSNARTLDWSGNESLAGNLTLTNSVTLQYNSTTKSLDFIFI